MIRISLGISALLIGTLALIVSLNSQAQETTTTITTEKTVITPVPAPKETVVPPSGYVNCFMVAAGWFNNVWVPEHRVCQYQQAAGTNYEGVAWVDSYWKCTQATADGNCTNWDWVPGHWVKTFEVY